MMTGHALDLADDSKVARVVFNLDDLQNLKISKITKIPIEISKMIKIPPKSLKLPNMLQNHQNDQNTHETFKMTKIPTKSLKSPNMLY